jgi:tetratricopeptide (TPR) repeat protein
LKIFVSYTSSDKDWAHWIGWNLREAGHEPFVHEWEIAAGENIPRWMEDRLGQADRLLGIFSDAYCKALYSQSERWAAYWQDPGGRTGFLVPVEVREVSKWPVFVEPLKRISLIGLNDVEARGRLLEFLNPPRPPTEEPAFPGAQSKETLAPSPFVTGGDSIGSTAPVFPISPSNAGAPPSAIDFSVSIRCIDEQEPNPIIFGRDDEIATIANALLEGRVVVVGGGPGMGKTALATAAIYQPRVVAHFGRRRVFASLEAASEPRAALAKLVETLGLPPTGDEVSLMRILETNAAEKPLAAILDNAETVFEVDRAGSERLLNLIGNIQGLSLVVTIRGVPPAVAGAIYIDDLPKLPAGPAREAFLTIAGATFTHDLNLPHLLEALDGHALSIRLIAAQAVGLPALRGLRESWDDAHAEILRISGETETRLTSVRASLALSLNSRRMKSTPLARRLLALLGLLPGGLAETGARSLLGERGTVTRAKANEAVACLHQLRLVERRPDQRLRMLTPLRESVRTDVVPFEADKERLVERFLRLASKGGEIATLRWENLREEIEPESDNLDAICNIALTTNGPDRLLENALQGLAEFNIHSGKGAVSSISRAVAQLSSGPPSMIGMQRIIRLGEVVYARSNVNAARIRFEEALSHSRKLNNARAEAYCLTNLGNCSNSQSDREAARKRYEEALLIARRTDSLQTEADCVLGLATIAAGRSNHKLAQAGLEEALVLYRRVGDALGEGNVIAHMGFVAAAQADHHRAVGLVEEALALHRRIGAVWGQWQCTHALGEIARRSLHYEVALIRFDETEVLSRHIGAVLGEAVCARSRALIAFAQSDYERAHARFEDALALYRRVGERLGEAEMTIRVGQVRQKLGDAKNRDLPCISESPIRRIGLERDGKKYS